MAILDEYIELGIETQDEEGREYAKELAQKYRQVPERYMFTVVQVCDPVSQFADDLAILLNKHFTKHPWSQKLDLSYRLTPLPHEIEGSSATTEGKSVSLDRRALSPVPKPSSPSASPATYARAVQTANLYYQNKRDATDSAGQMRRKGASNPLYRQAAGYYAERAREQGRYAQQATSDAAELLVDQTSTANSIDLHGVHVRDGVQITRQRLYAWWNALGEFRSKKAKDEPFIVVTGLGRHSAGGVSQMRQAVARTLLQEGWRMQVETGRFIITGRR